MWLLVFKVIIALVILWDVLNYLEKKIKLYSKKEYEYRVAALSGLLLGTVTRLLAIYFILF